MITLRVRYCYVQSLTLLVSLEMTRHDHSIIACSRHICVWCCSSRTSHSWWITQSTQHHRRGCNTSIAKLSDGAFVLAATDDVCSMVHLICLFMKIYLQALLQDNQLSWLALFCFLEQVVLLYCAFLNKLSCFIVLSWTSCLALLCFLAQVVWMCGEYNSILPTPIEAFWPIPIYW